MDFSDRLSALISDRGISSRELGRRIGVSHVTIGKWLRREVVPRGENLESLADFFEVTPAFLLYGEEGINGRQTIDIGEDEISIPVIDVKASCGGGNLSPLVMLVRMFRATRTWLSSKLMSPANLQTLHIVTADGDSMAPGIAHGDFAFIDTSQRYISADALYAIQYAGSIFIKRIMSRADGTVLLISDNPRYPPQEIQDPLSLTIIGRVVLIFNVHEP